MFADSIQTKRQFLIHPFIYLRNRLIILVPNYVCHSENDWLDPVYYEAHFNQNYAYDEYTALNFILHDYV